MGLVVTHSGNGYETTCTIRVGIVVVMADFFSPQVGEARTNMGWILQPRERGRDKHEYIRMATTDFVSYTNLG